MSSSQLRGTQTRGRAARFFTRGWALLGGVVIALVMLASCGDPEPPAVPLGPDGEPDPQLVLGREIWGANCSNCHGAEGEGGRGNRINGGRTLEKYPDVVDQIEVVVNGKGNGMPAWGDRLTEEQIEAVVAYTRAVL